MQRAKATPIPDYLLRTLRSTFAGVAHLPPNTTAGGATSQRVLSSLVMASDPSSKSYRAWDLGSRLLRPSANLPDKRFHFTPRHFIPIKFSDWHGSSSLVYLRFPRGMKAVSLLPGPRLLTRGWRLGAALSPGQLARVVMFDSSRLCRRTLKFNADACLRAPTLHAAERKLCDAKLAGM